jgi:DNA-directed RNA polymerase specialized sigma subunit
MKKKKRNLTDWHRQQVIDLDWVAGTLASRETKNKHLGNATEFDDLKQVALWGVCAAVYDWKPNGGKSISSYAWDRAFAYIGHYMRDKSRIIKIPRKIQKLYYNWCELIGKEPGLSQEEILIKLECTEKELEQAKRVGVSTPFQLFSETLQPEMDVITEEITATSTNMSDALLYLSQRVTEKEMELFKKHTKGELKKQSDKQRAVKLLKVLRDELLLRGFDPEEIYEGWK